jgi:hypothetical protein
LRGQLSHDDVDPLKLAARVRAELGRLVSHPRAVDVSAKDDGCIVLSGPILAGEADRTLAAVASVRGVCGVEDRLERHETADGVPALQGGSPRLRARSALLRDSWSPTTKLMVCLSGTALAAGVGYAIRESASAAP